LEKAVKGDCSGHFCGLLVGRIRPNEVVKAKAVKKATKGAGTNDGRLIDIFAFSTNAELAQIKSIEKNTEKMVDGDTSGYFQKGLKDLMKGDRIEAAYLDDKQAELDAEVLYKAGEGKVGTDEKTFIRILCNHTPWYNAHINRFYVKKYSHDLLKAIKKETSGDFEKLLLALVMEPYAYWADRLYNAMKGAGTDDKTLVYVVSILSQTELLHVAKIFTERHHKDLKKMIEGDTSGWYQKTLLALLGH
jgi:annexin A7/11